MPLTVLLPVVVIGLVLVIGTSWWRAEAHPPLDEPTVHGVFEARTGVEPRGIALDGTGRGALVRHPGGVGAVLQVGGRLWVREHVVLRREGQGVTVVSNEWGSPPRHLALDPSGWVDA